MDKYSWGLTVSIKGGAAPIENARRLAARYAVPYVPRENLSLGELKGLLGLDYLLVVDRDGRLFMEEPPLHWHPSMALPRLRRIAQGKPDVFLAAAALAPGQRFLDCTLGLAADALVAAWAVGEGGEVLGLEASPVIAAITEWGLAHEAPRFDSKQAPLAALARRVRVLPAEALPYLRTQAAGSWDVVYFDPMFQAGKHNSPAINNLRPVACYDAFNGETLAEALRVCRRRVVLKERWFSPLFQRLGARRLEKTKYGPVAYGVWEKEETASD
jgi:hypothetical protein